MPICNEDVMRVFAGLRVERVSLATETRRLDVYIIATVITRISAWRSKGVDGLIAEVQGEAKFCKSPPPPYETQKRQ